MPTSGLGHDGTLRIPLAAPNVSAADRAAVAESLESTTIAYGRRVEAFESAVAGFMGDCSAIAVQSGTAALHLALIVAGIGQGDDVLMPSLTFIAPANAARYVGAAPVLVDVEPTYRQLDVERAQLYLERHYRPSRGGPIHRRTGRRAAAVLAVDLLGHPCDHNALGELCDRFDLILIDDAAEALGAEYERRPVGSTAELSTLSFNANKIVTSAGGGMLLCAREEHAVHGRLLANQAKQLGVHYRHTEVGFNYGMAAPQAALGNSQFARLGEFVKRKRAIAARYAATLAGVAGLTLPAEADWARSTNWLYTVHLDRSLATRDTVMQELDIAGIETRPLFDPMHRVVAHAGAEADSCHISEGLSATGLSLPSSTSLTEEQVDHVAQTVLETLCL